MSTFLSHLRNIIMGVILGTFLVSVPLSVFFGATYVIGIIGAVIGIVAYYLLIAKK